MAKYEDIQRANESIKTTNIKGKEYAEVNQRIKAFRMVYPEGYIITEMLSNSDGVCVFRATCGWYDTEGNAQTIGVGHSYEKEGSSRINETSYIENCETSAVGRALGMAGFGIDTSVASYEEVQNAIINQDLKNKPKMEYTKPEPVQDGKKELAKRLKEVLEDKGVDVKEFCKENGITKDSSEADLRKAINVAGVI